MKKIHIIIIISLIIFAAFLVYFPSFSSYFFQDDWYSFAISSINSPQDLLNLFLPNKGVVYYRPLGMQIPFFINHSLFGINPLPFKLFTFLFHSLNTVFVFLIMTKLSKNHSASLISSFLYATSGIHYIPFFWSSTIAFVIGPSLTFLSIIFFIDRKYILSFLFFILGILTFEIAVVIPMILSSFVLTQRNKINIRVLMPFITVSAFYLFFRLLFMPPPDIPDYHLSFGLNSLLNIKHYLLWSLNWPEEMKNQFVTVVKINPDFIRNFKGFYIALVFSSFINLFLLVIFPFVFTVFGKIKISYRFIPFALCWFFSGLIPVIFFPLHAFPYYLPVSFVGLLLLTVPVFCDLSVKIKKIFKPSFTVLTGLLIISWLWSVFNLMGFNSKVHWAQRRSKISKVYALKAKNLNKNGIIKNRIFVKFDAEIKLSLNNQDAMRIIFNNPDFETVYSNEETDLINL